MACSNQSASRVAAWITSTRSQTLRNDRFMIRCKVGAAWGRARERSMRDAPWRSCAREIAGLRRRAKQSAMNPIRPGIRQLGIGAKARPRR